MPGTILNIENITNLYLFGQETVPSNLISDQFIRPQGSGAFVTADGAQFMSSGGGRFAVGAAFEIIQDFFNDTSLAPGTYSKIQLAQKYNLNSITLNIKQYELDDNSGDYQERVYIYNQTAFMISSNADFYVAQDGTKEIRNYSIVPYGLENFDFTGSNPVINLFQGFLLQYKIDPSSIGRTVSINFDLSGVPEHTYTYGDFAYETVKWSQYTHVSNIGGLLDMPSVVNGLFDAGVIAYTQDGLAVRWLTDQSDSGINAAAASQLSLHPIVSAAAAAGQIVMMGAGADEFNVDWGDYGARFDLYGGAGVDTVTSSDENDSNWTIQLHGVEYFHGSPFGDTVEILSSGTDITSILTGDGNDTVRIKGGGISATVDLGAGYDEVDLSSDGSGFINGGDDFDWVDFSQYTHGINVSLSSAMFVDNYILTNFEALAGTIYDDHISGSSFNVNGNDGDDIITLADGYASGDGGNDTINITRGQAYGGDGNDTIYSHDTSDVIFGDDGDDTVHILEGTSGVYGGAGYDKLYITGHIDPYNGYDGFEEVHASQENDVVHYTDGTKSVHTFNGDDTIYVTLHRHSNSAIDNYFVDGGDGSDTLIVTRETGGTSLTIQNIETAIDPTRNESIAWVAQSGEKQVTSPGDPRSIWFVDSGYSRYSLYVEKAWNYETTGKVTVSYFYSEDLRLEGDSPGYGIGFTVNNFHSGDLGILL